LIELYADGGVEFVGLDNARPHDKFGVAVGYAKVSRAARALDADFRQRFGKAWPLRDAEAMVTAVYQYEVRAGLNLQPNFQFIHHPGGGGTDPLGNLPGRKLRDANVIGLRTVLKF
jgi:porin